jgi:hypothetical protein
MVGLAEYRRISFGNEDEYGNVLELQDTHVGLASTSNDGFHHRVTETALRDKNERSNFGNEHSPELLASASETANVVGGHEWERQNKRNIYFSNATRRINRPSWFMTVSVGVILVLVVMIINAGILGWIYSSFRPADNGTVILFSGSCSKASLITDLSHLAINILSTLLLAVSNHCAQLLFSPTRADVDKAHKNGQWLHIGGFSYRNLPWIKYWRIIGCSCLILSSLPLHLL